MANVKTLINPAYPPGRTVNYGVRSNLRLPFRTDTTRAVVKAPIAAVVSAFPSDPNFDTAPGLSIATRRSSGDDWRINSANLQGAPGTIADALRVQRNQMALQQYTDKYFDVTRDNVGPIGPVSAYPTYDQVKLDRDVQYAYPDAQASLNYYPDKLMYRGAALGDGLFDQQSQRELPQNAPQIVPFIPPTIWAALYKLYKRLATQAQGDTTGAQVAAVAKGIIDTFWTQYANVMENPSYSSAEKQNAVDQFYRKVREQEGMAALLIAEYPPCYSFNPAGMERCSNDRCKGLFCASGKDDGSGTMVTINNPGTSTSTDNTALYIGLGVGVVALLGAAYFLTKK